MATHIYVRIHVFKTFLSNILHLIAHAPSEYITFTWRWRRHRCECFVPFTNGKLRDGVFFKFYSIVEHFIRCRFCILMDKKVHVRFQKTEFHGHHEHFFYLLILFNSNFYVSDIWLARVNFDILNSQKWSVQCAWKWCWCVGRTE